MKIIIVGIGKVGYTLAKHLSAEDNDVAVIDKSQEAIDWAGDSLDVMCLRGRPFHQRSFGGQCAGDRSDHCHHAQ